MSKRLILILALAFVVGLTCAAFAEVQNVKVSGDLTVKGVYRNNLDLAKNPVGGNNPNEGRISGTTPTLINTQLFQDKQQFLMSITRVRVDADLTDNVMTTVRLINERNWNGESPNPSSSNTNVFSQTPVALSDQPAEDQIDIDLAYVTMKEFLYSPLTLTVGRQELRFNNGWIVGDPDTNGVAFHSALAAGDLSARKSFDAVRATLDYNPLTVDVIYAKIAENNVALNDDTTLSGINAAYELTKSTTLEGFFYSKITGSDAPAVMNLDRGDAIGFLNTAAGASTTKQRADQVYTVGGRAVNRSIKDLTVDMQAAYQFGTYNPKFDTNARWFQDTVPIYKAEVSHRSAWGAEFVAMYNLKDIANKYKTTARFAKYDPMVSACYIYLSGESRDKTGDKTYRGWDPMFEDQTMGSLINAIFGFSNIHLLGLSAQAKPITDVSVKVDWVAANFDKRYPEGRLVVLSGVPGANAFIMTKNPFVGQEIDTTMTYDYTEDVQFSLLGGLFLPGKAINERNGSNAPNRAAATELIGSMKVTF